MSRYICTLSKDIANEIVRLSEAYTGLFTFSLNDGIDDFLK